MEILFQSLADPGTVVNPTPGAHLSALAIELRTKIAEAKHDFGRFPGVRWLNPVK